MAMFDLKDSEDIKLTECHTDAQTLLKGEGLTRLEVKNSTAAARPAKQNRKIFRVVGDHLFAAILSLAVALTTAYLVYRFGWS